MNTAHDRINLTRFVARLQREVDPASDDWHVSPDTLKRTHLHVTAVTRKIAFARELLARVEEQELDEPQSSSRQDANAAIAQTLDLAEDVVQNVQGRIAVLRESEPKKPSLLASLPIPTEPAPALSILPSDVHSPADERDHLLHAPTPHDEPLALFPSTPRPQQSKPDRNLLPSEPPAFLSTSLQTQEHLSAQLAEMATLLKRGAQEFGSALEKDRAVLEITQNKIELNLDRMVAQRKSLHGYTVKGSGTTWLVMGSVVAVAVAWVVMLFLIRFTRW